MWPSLRPCFQMGKVASGVGTREGGGAGESTSFFSEEQLEKGMARLLKTSPFPSHRWHAFRRGAAYGLREGGLEWKELMLMGDWRSLGEAKHYATPSFPLQFTFEWELPLPPDQNSRCTYVRGSFRDLYAPRVFEGKKLPAVRRPGELPKEARRRLY